MAASVSVVSEGHLINATYRGTMTMDLVREAEKKIEAFLNITSDARVLYNTLDMDPPSMELALEMKAIDSRIQSRLVRSATDDRDAKTAFMAKVAYVLSRDHKVFYNDLDKALEWLGVRDRVLV